jgi:hypothetical protein
MDAKGQIGHLKGKAGQLHIVIVVFNEKNLRGSAAGLFAVQWFVLSCGNCETKCASFSRLGFHPNPAAVATYYTATDSQSDAGARIIFFVV